MELEKQTTESSEEVQEILDHTPHWLIRNGITIVFLILLLTIGASLVIRYPIYIKAKAIITSSNPSVTLVSPETGRIILLKRDNDEVHSGDYLAVIENPGETADVLRLKAALSKFDIQNLESISDSLFEEPLILGEIQDDYSRFVVSIKNYRQLIETDFFEEKLQNQDQQVALFNEMHQRLSNQTKLIQQELEISAKKFLKQQELYLAGLISREEMEQSELEYSQKKQSLKTNEIGQLNSLVNQEKNKHANLEVKHTFVETKQLLGIDLARNFKQLLSAINGWEQRFVLKSPGDGLVSLSKPFSILQHVKQGEEIISVDPQQKDMKALVFIPQQNAGKVKLGLTVNIKLYNYPTEEYGVIRGVVKNISSTSLDNNFLVEVRLPNNLVTTYKRTINYQYGLEGDAEIITDNLLLFRRIFNQLDKRS